MNFLQADVCAGSQVRLKVINAIPCEKALEIASVLHQHLKFGVEGPYIYDKDRVDACAVPLCRQDPGLKDHCAYYEERAAEAAAGRPVKAIARIDSEAEGKAISVCVNELYGISE